MRFRLFVVFTALFLSACGGSNNGDTPQYNRTDATNPLNTVEHCKASDLEAKVQTSSRSGSDLSLIVALSSKSNDSCTVSGFPGINLNLDEKTPIAATVSETNESKNSQTLKKGESAYFDVSYSAVSSGSDCMTANFLYVTPPDDDQALHLPLTGDQVLSICGTANVKVSPVRVSA